MRFPVIVALCLLLTAVRATATPILNGSFETGDFTGWNVYIGVGSSVLPEGMTVPAGDATVTPLLQGSFCYCGAEPRPPADGAYLAAIMVGSFFDPLSPVVDVTISQSLSLTLGDTLSGWSFFYNGDLVEQDTAYVRVLDDLGNIVATPWFDQSGPDDFLATGPWAPWAWTAPNDGLYTLVLGSSTRGDARLESAAGFDRISVPEPSTVWLLAIGVFACSRFALRQP